MKNAHVKVGRRSNAQISHVTCQEGERGSLAHFGLASIYLWILKAAVRNRLITMYVDKKRW